MFGIGLYGGFIQVGVGVLFIVVLYRLLKIDLTQVNVFKVFIVLMYTLPALAVFVFDGQVRWAYGLVLAVGNMSGAFLGARVNMSPCRCAFGQVADGGGDLPHRPQAGADLMLI